MNENDIKIKGAYESWLLSIAAENMNKETKELMQSVADTLNFARTQGKFNIHMGFGQTQYSTDQITTMCEYMKAMGYKISMSTSHYGNTEHVIINYVTISWVHPNKG